MKSEKMTGRTPVQEINPIVIVLASVLAFALVLGAAMSLLGRADGEIKTDGSRPGRLVSVGAPQSQLELKRRFEAMGLVYEDGGRLIYEPVSGEYRAAIADRIENGEKLSLSVEEVLYIISDTVAAYDKYDVIRLRGAEGGTERVIRPVEVRESADGPMFRAALTRRLQIVEVIEYRLSALSSSDAFENAEDGRVYLPDGGAGKRFFLGSEYGLEEGRDMLSFLSEDNRDVLLFPTETDNWLCSASVIGQGEREISEDESELLAAFGYEEVRAITPLYWYGECGVRLFAAGGKVVLADLEAGECRELLPEGYRLASAALLKRESGAAELYFTASRTDGAAVFVYRGGEIQLLHETKDGYLAVIEDLSLSGYGRVRVFTAERHDDERFVVALECQNLLQTYG